jgi:hypothetical protein
VADTRTSSLGGIIAGVLGLLVVAGIAGTPIYLAYLRSDARSLDAAVRDDVEILRRALLNLDFNVEAMKGAQEKLGTEKAPKKEVTDLLEANGKLLQQAETSVTRLADLRQGQVLAGAHLDVGRIKAMFYLTAGTIHRHQAEFEESWAEGLRRTAEQRLDLVTDLRREVVAIEARKPAAAVAELDKAVEEVDAKLKEQRSQTAELAKVVADKEDQLVKLERQAKQAREKLADLEVQGVQGEAWGEYVDLSARARKAEAEAAALLNGALEGARPVAPEGPEPIGRLTYEGGKPQKGLVELRHGLETRQQQVAGLEQMKIDLGAKRETLQSSIAGLDAAKSELDAKIAEQLQQVDGLVAEAAQHAEKAEKSRQTALSALEKKAADFAKHAISAAKERTRDATSALRELGDAVDERLQRISKDGDTEAALDCLAAEIAYQTALVRLDQLNARQAAQDSDAYIAKMTGREAPTPDAAAMDELRAKAAVELKNATEGFTQARKLIKPSTLKTADGTTITGANYVWQIDVGQAAINLLEANLAGDRAARLEAQKKAYALLVEAAKDRDQSPLLSPAVETIEYLQRTAR